MFSLVLLIAVAAALLFLPALQQIGDPVSRDQRALWNENGSPDYQIRLLTVAPPAPPIGLELTVQGGQITQERILACDSPSDEYPADLCEPIRVYYGWMGRYTINQLFELADNGTWRTRNSMAKCAAFTIQNFQGFSSSDELGQAACLCQTDLQSSDLLASVEYDPIYGYPSRIMNYIRQVMDGGLSVEVQAYRPLP